MPENGKTFSSQGKSGNFEQIGKSQGILPKIVESEEFLTKILKKLGNFSHFVFFSDF